MGETGKRGKEAIERSSYRVKFSMKSRRQICRFCRNPELSSEKMRDVINFLKQRRNVKYSLGMIIFGLIFAFSFQANRLQIPQILEKPIRIVFGSEEARQYQVSGWQGAYVKGEKSILKVVLPERKTYRMVIKAFSCSPPDVRDQRIEVHFNDVALDRLKFRKTPKWQEFKVNIYPYLLKENNTIKFVYIQDTHLSPIVFDSLEFRNHIFRIKGFYLLSDSPIPKFEREPLLFIELFFYPPLPKTTFSFKVLGYSLVFLIFFLFFSLFCARLFSFHAKIKLSKGFRLDLFTYLPSIILLSLPALFSFFSPYHFFCSLKTFFVLTLAPTAVLKLFPYKDLFLRCIKIIFRYVEKTYREVKRAFSFLKKQPNTFRKLLIRYHKTNLSSALILDFMLLLILCAFLLMVKAEWIAKQLANLAYFLLVIGVVMKAVAFFRESRRKG